MGTDSNALNRATDVDAELLRILYSGRAFSLPAGESDWLHWAPESARAGTPRH